MYTIPRLACVGFSLLALATSAWGVTRTWDGGGGDNAWGTAANWSSDTVPATNDQARLVPLTVPIQLVSNQIVGDLQFSGTPNATMVEGLGQTLTIATGKISGNGNGSQTGGLACDVVIGGSSTWGPLTAWGSRLKVYGDVSDLDGGHSVTFVGDSNGGTVIGGTWDIGGSLIAQCYTVVIGASYTDSSSVTTYGGKIQSAASIDLDCRMGYSDNHDTYFVLDNTAAANSDRIASGIPVRTVRNGGSFELKGNATTPVAESLSLLDLQSGQLKTLRANGASTDLIIESVQRVSGTSLLFSDVNGGRTRVTGATNTNGIWKPWAFNASNYVKVGTDDAILACATGDYLALASAGNDPTKLYKTAADVALTGSTAVWGLRLEATTAQTLNLGTNNLTIGSGALIATGNNNKLVTGTAGKLIFAGDDVIINTDGTGTFTNAAKMAWSKPAGSTQTHPSLVFARGYRDIVSLSGEDLIGTYSNLFGSVYQSPTRTILALDGPSDRTFNGTVVGVFNLEKRGPGTLTFNGPDWRRAGNVTVYEGRLVGGAPGAPVPTGGVKAGARYDIAAGVDVYNYPKIEAGGAIGGSGRDLYPLGTKYFLPGAILSPGMQDEVGLFTITSTFSPAGDFVYEVEVDENDSDRLHVVGAFTFPPTGSTVTFRIKDLSNRTAQMRNRDLIVLTSQTAMSGTDNIVNYVVESASPQVFDTSEADVVVDTTAWTITITGIKNTPQCTTLILR